MFYSFYSMFFRKKAAKSQSPENRILVGLIARLRDRPMEGKRKGLVSLPVSRDCTAERHRDKRRPAALSPGVSAVGKFRPRLGWDLGRGIRRASPQIWEWWVQSPGESNYQNWLGDFPFRNSWDLFWHHFHLGCDVKMTCMKSLKSLGVAHST